MSSTGHWTTIDQESVRADLAKLFEHVLKQRKIGPDALRRELAAEIGFNEQSIEAWLVKPPENSCMYRVPKKMWAALVKRVGE